MNKNNFYALLFVVLSQAGCVALSVSEPVDWSWHVGKARCDSVRDCVRGY